MKRGLTLTTMECISVHFSKTFFWFSEQKLISYFDYLGSNGICDMNGDTVFKGFIVSLLCLVMGA